MQSVSDLCRANTTTATSSDDDELRRRRLLFGLGERAAKCSSGVRRKWFRCCSALAAEWEAEGQAEEDGGAEELSTWALVGRGRCAAGRVARAQLLTPKASGRRESGRTDTPARIQWHPIARAPNQAGRQTMGQRRRRTTDAEANGEKKREEGERREEREHEGRGEVRRRQ